MKTGARAGSTRRRQEHPTSSRPAAAAWLRSSKRPRREARLFIEALRFAEALKQDDALRQREARRKTRHASQVQRKALELARKNPDLLKVELRSPEHDWSGIRYTQRRVDLALQAFPNGRAASTRLTRAIAAFFLDVGTIPPATLAPVMLSLVSRAVRIRKPSGLEAAVLAVAAKTEPEAAQPNQQTEAERRWRARFRSEIVKDIARDALFDHALGLKHAEVFGDGRLTPRRGRQTDRHTK